jgi:hypothetical protein
MHYKRSDTVAPYPVKTHAHTHTIPEYKVPKARIFCLLVENVAQKLLTRGVSITPWPCHLHFKSIFKAKEELWKLKYSTMQKHNLQKIL